MSRALALALLAAVLPSTAAAKGRSLAVAELATPPNLLGIGAKLAQDIVSAASSQPGVTVLDPMQVAMALGPESLKKLKACEGRPECVAQHAAKLDVDRIVVGSLDRTEAHYRVRLFLVDLGTKRIQSSIDRSVLIASRRLNKDIAEAIPGLLAGKAEASGLARIESSPPGASVTFDGEPKGRTPLTVETKPGKHTVALELKDHLPVERFVDVEAGQTSTLEVRLTLRPGAKAEPAVAAKATESTEEAGGFSIPVATWIAGGVAVAAAGSGVYFGLQVRDANARAVDADGDGALDLTRLEAQQAKRDALIANVSYGVAGAAAVAAVLFAVLGGDDAPAASQASSLQPGVAFLGDGAAVSLGGSF